MHRFTVAPLSALAAVAAIGLAPLHSASAETVFDTTLTQLSGSSYQLVDNFSLLFDLDNAYLDLDMDNNPDQTVFFGAGEFQGDYNDPEHYILDFALPGTGTELRPFYMGSELTGAATVDWRLSYATTPGDESTIYSTIMSGSAEYAGLSGGLTLTVTDGLEWPVSGWSIEDVGIPLGTHYGVKLADFDTLFFDYSGNLSANVIPAPGVIALMGIAGLASGRRRR